MPRDFSSEQEIQEQARAFGPPHPARPATDEVLSRLVLGRARVAEATCWTKAPSQGHRGKWCAGLSVAPDEDDVFDDAGVAAWNALAMALPFGAKSVPDFNDANTTTHADILALFDRAIEQRRKEIA